MAVYYRLYQNKRKGSSTINMWYARAQKVGDVKLDTLADRIQRNCTAKRSDVLAVLAELVEVMGDELRAGKRVILDGFGSFKIGISSRPAQEPKTFSVTKNVKGVHVLFQPELHIDRNHNRTRTFLSGVKLQELADYTDPYTGPDGQQKTNP